MWAGYGVARWVVRGSPGGPLTRLGGPEGRRAPLSLEDRAAVLPLFVDDVHLLEDITGDSYADWLEIQDTPVHVPGGRS